MNVKEMVEEINNLAEQGNETIIQIGKLIWENTKDLDEKKINAVIREIKKSESLKFTPAYVWEGYAMYRARPELLDSSQRKLSLSHYRQLYRINMSEGVREQMEYAAVSEGWGVRRLKEEVKSWKMEKRKEEDPDVVKRKERLKVAHKLVNNLDLAGVEKVIGFIEGLVGSDSSGGGE